MRDHDNINNQLLQPDHDSIGPSASSSAAHDTLTTTTSENLEKTSGRWTKNKITLLLDYVKKNCILTTARGLNLKKLEFNKARTVVKSKDANECHYKCGHVHIVINYINFNYLSVLQLCAIYKAVLQWDKKSGSGWHDDYSANA